MHSGNDVEETTPFSVENMQTRTPHNNKVQANARYFYNVIQ